MISTVWRKVLRDLWHNKFRTAMVVLSTAVGVFALGFVYGASDVLRARMTESHRASLFPHITFYTGPFDLEAVNMIQQEDGVAEAEGQHITTIRWKLEGEPDWHNAFVYARDDYESQRVDLLELLEGSWPAGRTLAVERLTSLHFQIPAGASIIVEFGRGERHLPVKGIVRQSQVNPPQWGGDAAFFATMETVSWLTDQEQGFNRLDILLESFSDVGAEEASERIQDRLERMDIRVGGYTITDPDVHWAQETIDAVLLILKVLGALSLGLSGFLIINMMNATVAQQAWQVGVMKVVGATFGRVVRTYLMMAALYGLLSLFLAVLPAAVTAHLLADWLLELLNITDTPFLVMPAAISIQIAVGLIVPLLAASVPVIGSARITPHQAISSYGLGSGFGSSWLDRLIGRLRRLPRPLMLSLRNTFRRKTRVALTLATLALGGLMFIVVVSVGASMNNTIEVLINDFGFDIMIVFERAHRVPRLVEVTESIPGVTRAEVWDVYLAELELGGGEELQGQLWGVPDNSHLFTPRIVSGRTLQPEDGRTILLNSKIAADYNIRVGDTVTMTVAERELTWTVAGLIINVNNMQRDNFVPFDTLARETGNANRGSFVLIASEEHDLKTHQRMIRDMRATYTAHRLKPVFFQSGSELRALTKAQFDIIVYLMLAMALLAAVVGSIGLTSTMSINVAERAREIGVMRAIGATSAAILGIFLSEGVLTGVLSWLIATPFSYLGAYFFSNVVGDTLFQLPLDFDYSLGGLIGWLVIVVILSALASLWPALRATQISVRESLAYE